MASVEVSFSPFQVGRGSVFQWERRAPRLRRTVRSQGGREMTTSMFHLLPRLWSTRRKAHSTVKSRTISSVTYVYVSSTRFFLVVHCLLVILTFLSSSDFSVCLLCESLKNVFKIVRNSTTKAFIVNLMHTS